MSETPFVETDLYGFLAPDFDSPDRIAVKFEDLPAKLPAQETIGPTRVYDARSVQAREQSEGTFSEADFFEEHGFVLLSHESEVQDWDIDPSQPEMDQEAARVYGPEAESLIRSRLLPGRKVEIQQGAPQRRGPGTATPFYAGAVHQDYGLRPEDFEESLEAFVAPEIVRGWRERFDQDDVAGFVLVNLWRPVSMQDPLMHMPLAVCEPRSVRVEDCVPLSLLEFSPTGRPTNQLALRRHPAQRWYYYPGMTGEEVLAFKNYQFFKDDSEAKVEACFHTAFEDPTAPAGVEERQSCEHRVSVFVLRD